MPDSPTPQPTDGTEAIQDGWVTSPKNLRKSSSSFEPEAPEAKTDSKPWDYLQDGWDKHK